jgi:hypothetical protein
MSDPSRAYRNNNPGNIRVSPRQAWQGTITDPLKMTPDQRAETEFVVFLAPMWGFRALAKTLVSYKRIGVSTVEGIISRWAPPSDSNDTEAYIRAVCADTGFGRKQMIDAEDPDQCFAVAKAIARHETGGWPWLDADLAEGINRAGVH